MDLQRENRDAIMKTKLYNLYFIIILLILSSCAPNKFLEYDIQTQEKIDKAIHNILLSQMNGLKLGEAKTEGHIILTSEEKEGKLFVYIIDGYSTFGFINNKFCAQGPGTFPAGLSPAVVFFPKIGDYDNCTILQGEKNVYGNDEKWIRENFPVSFVNRAINSGDEIDEIYKQEYDQAEAYLTSNGSSATIFEDIMEYEYFHISKQAYNTLQEMNIFALFPDWIGSKETVENNTRYIYESKEETDTNGSTILIFSKKLTDGSIVMQYKYLINGDKLERIS
jgi:hypothetical protein